ncbi:class I tRNA ligase family protein [Legionella sp. D16C41]|uniref:class I tRNA ligase family protein n=1 Tax=Legionella sp. D16C41 TaxID=3402688 RepID=UPI003AF6C8F3
MFTKKDYLIIPSVPTPNGRLHLGHVGGPYLRADILKRYLQMQGHSVLMMCGSDSFESYVTLQADKEGKYPENVCNYYHPLIASDLNAMDISLDYFINPLSDYWLPTYTKWHNDILKRLIATDNIKQVSELFAWDNQNNRYLVGCWLSGYCPMCKIETESYFCEDCGAHYKPEEAYNNLKYTKYNVKNLFLKLPKTVNLEHLGINDEHKDKFNAYLKQQHNLFRLTTHSSWGLSFNDSSTLFSYGFIFSYFLLFGDLAGQLLGLGKNAFAIDSNVTTVASFGHDNFLPFISSILGISNGCSEYKPIDYYLINYFYHLDGNKFSTSRRHAIWVEEAITKHKFSSDIVRAYLASIDVQNSTGQFNFIEFNNYYSWTLSWIEKYIYQVWKPFSLNKITKECCADLKEKIIIFLSFQEKNLSLKHFSPHLAINLLDDWLELGQTLNPQQPNYFWWLQTLALFLYPFMPKFAKNLWQSLGYPNFPAKKYLFIPPPFSIQNKFNNSLSIHQTDLVY